MTIMEFINQELANERRSFTLYKVCDKIIQDILHGKHNLRGMDEITEAVKLSIEPVIDLNIHLVTNHITEDEADTLLRPIVMREELTSISDIDSCLKIDVHSDNIKKFASRCYYQELELTDDNITELKYLIKKEFKIDPHDNIELLGYLKYYLSSLRLRDESIGYDGRVIDYTLYIETDRYANMDNGAILKDLLRRYLEDRHFIHSEKKVSLKPLYPKENPSDYTRLDEYNVVVRKFIEIIRLIDKNLQL